MRRDSSAADHASDRQTSFALGAPDTWQKNSYTQPIPSGATHASLAIRASGGTNDVVYFDDLSLTQP